MSDILKQKKNRERETVKFGTDKEEYKVHLTTVTSPMKEGAGS